MATSIGSVLDATSGLSMGLFYARRSVYGQSARGLERAHVATLRNMFSTVFESRSFLMPAANSKTSFTWLSF